MGTHVFWQALARQASSNAPSEYVPALYAFASAQSPLSATLPGLADCLSCAAERHHECEYATLHLKRLGS